MRGAHDPDGAEFLPGESPRSDGAAEVLLIIPDLDLLDLIAFALRANGFRVTAAGTPRAALSQQIQRPDIAVLDSAMGHRARRAFVAALRRSREMPIVVLTEAGEPGWSEPERRIESMPKPLSPRALIDRIRALLQESAA
jgi:DNA-binding response OmpR family regulator